jgi:Spondin_N
VRLSSASTCLLALAWLGGASSATAATPTAQYTVRFDATWNRGSHPVEFPADAHFSPLVGGTHDSRVRFWRPGDPASDGIERMAEGGRTGPLADEIAAAVRAGTAEQGFTGAGIDSPGSTSFPFTLSRQYPLVTLVTMVAPSPDWFVGVAGLSLIEDGKWVEEKVVALAGYDAGSDDGTTFRSPDDDTVPKQPVARLAGGPLGNGKPLGTFTFTRTDATLPPPLRLGAGRFALRVRWEKPNGTRGSGTPVQLTGDSGYFWFFDAANVELVVKVIDACGTFGRFWVFAAGLTDVGVELTVEDTRTGASRTYRNPAGTPYPPLQDTRAFATCGG